MIENNLSPAETRKLIEKEFSIKDLSVKDNRTYPKIVRHLYMYFGMKNKSTTLEVVASEVGRCHASCINSLKFVNNILDTNDIKIKPFFDKASKVITLNQKGGYDNLKDRMKHHLQQVEIIKEAIENAKEERKKLIEKKKEAEKANRSEKAQDLLDNLMLASDQDQILRSRLNKWFETRLATDLLKCTRIIGFKHYEDFQTFSDLNRSIQT